MQWILFREKKEVEIEKKNESAKLAKIIHLLSAKPFLREFFSVSNLFEVHLQCPKTCAKETSVIFLILRKVANKIGT